MSGSAEPHEPASLPSADVTWLAVKPTRQADPDVDLVRARVATSLFGEAREPGRVGRYVLLHRIGAGGMGVVYAAYDPELDRKIAIKILHALDGEEQASLRQEARALARLAHPHVVSAYDVGVFERGDGEAPLMFFAMEFVEGRTLTAWLAERKRSHREIVDLLLEAGRGLAAAHAVGIVHGDFKPDNVLVDRDGHAHVVDFGLARAHEHPRSGHTASHDDAQSGSHGEDTPVYGGTPAYMSPEQFAGVAIDPRSDQFAFCVTLWEALYGERPFGGKSLTELATNIVEGNRRAAPPGVRLPRWLRKAMTRGLAIAADDRWPTLDDLLHALARGRGRARVLASLVALGLVVLAAVLVLALQRLDERSRIAACEDAGTELDAIWNDDARARVRAGLLATGSGYAATAAQKVIPVIDTYAEAWRTARTEACLDADVRARWSEDVLARAVECLDDRKLQVEALVAELEHADAQATTSAVWAATGLSRIEPCRDEALLLRSLSPPADAREEVQAIRADLSRAGAAETMGKYDEALPLARDALARAETLGWAPLVASARRRVASLLERTGAQTEAETMFEASYFEAATAGATAEALAAAQGLVALVGYRLARPADGERWWKHAEVMRAAWPDPERLQEARNLGKLALVRHAAGEHEEALAMYEEALAIQEEALGPDHLDVGLALANISLLRHELGDDAEAAALQERALAIEEGILGPDHSQVAAGLGNLGNMHIAMGDQEQGVALLERALAIREKTLGPEHPDVATSLNNLSNAHTQMGAIGKALPLQRRALAIREKALGPDHPDVAMSLANLAVVHIQLGEREEAMKLFERAVAIAEAALGPEHPDVALYRSMMEKLRGDMADAG